MNKIRKIIELQETTDLSLRQIAKALNVSRPVVTQYVRDIKKSGLKYEKLKQISDSDLLDLLDNNKKSKNKKYNDLVDQFTYFTKELTKKGVTLFTLWEEHKNKCSNSYSYSQFCFHFQVWKNSSEITMHQKHKAGDKTFVDYAGEPLKVTDIITREEKAIPVFVAILGSSGLTYAEATENRKSENWIRSNERAIRYFGGVTNAIVPDNLKTGVSKTCKYEPGINALYDDFAEYYRTVIVPARTYSARDKALVENAVKIIYMRIYAKLRNSVFYTIDELNEAIFELLEKHNNTNFQRLKISRRELFEQTEKQYLKSLPVELYPLKKFKQLKVQFNYHIELREDMHYYSVPFELIGKKVRVIYDERNVAIYYDSIRVYQHKRDFTVNEYTTITSHMPLNHKFYSKWSPERFKSWAFKVGNNTENIIEEVLSSRKHPEQAYKVCLGILSLAQKHSSRLLEKACKKAIYLGTASYKKIKLLIEQIKENEIHPVLDFEEKTIEHENIRGEKYYN